MNMLARIVPPPAALEGERLSVRAERVAAMLDCDRSQVYRLITDGELEAHGIGERGVRVYLDSVQSYRDRHRIVPAGRTKKAKPKPEKLTSPASKAAQSAALASLRAEGLR